MTHESFDGASEYAHRLAARTGSPYQSDRTWRRRPGGLALYVRAVRDLLALIGLVVSVGAFLVAAAAVAG